MLKHKKVQLPHDWFGTPIWPPFHCFWTPIWRVWRHVKTLFAITRLRRKKGTCCPNLLYGITNNFSKKKIEEIVMMPSFLVLITIFFQSLTAVATYISSFSFSTKCSRGRKQKFTVGKQRALTWPACATQEKANSLKRTYACSGIILVSPNCG